jgi:hypothetical protein
MLAFYRHFIKSSGVKVLEWAQTSPLGEMVESYKCFPPVRKMPTLIANWMRAKLKILLNPNIELYAKYIKPL